VAASFAAPLSGKNTSVTITDDNDNDNDDEGHTGPVEDGDIPTVSEKVDDALEKVMEKATDCLAAVKEQIDLCVVAERMLLAEVKRAKDFALALSEAARRAKEQSDKAKEQSDKLAEEAKRANEMAISLDGAHAQMKKTVAHCLGHKEKTELSFCAANDVKHAVRHWFPSGNTST
jgi:hypothetical protein